MPDNNVDARKAITDDQVMDQVAEEPKHLPDIGATDYALESLDFVAPLSPGTQTLTSGLVQPRALGSSPWIAANLSIFSPAAMQSSPVQHSPIRWRIASPPMQPEGRAIVNVSSAADVAQPEVEEMQQSQPVSKTQVDVENADNDHLQLEEGSPVTAVAVPEGDEQGYGDAEVNYMLDAEYRNFERDDSPLSSHDGEMGTGEDAEQVVVETAETVQSSTDHPDDSQESQSNDDQEKENHDIYDVPKLPLEDAPTSPTFDTRLVPLASPSHDAVVSIRKPTPKKTKKNGRICLRLPLNPIIVKLEPEGEYSGEGEVAVESHSGESTVLEHVIHADASEASESEGGNGDSLQEQEEQGEEQEEPENTEQKEDNVSASPRPSAAVFSSEGELSNTEVQPATDSSAPTLPDTTPTSTIAPQLNECSLEERLDSVVTSIHDASTVVPSRLQEPTVTAIIVAESPFSSASPLATVSALKTVTAHATPAKQVFRESVSSVSVSSDDPRAAARAAALLKLVRIRFSAETTQ